MKTSVALLVFLSFACVVCSNFNPRNSTIVIPAETIDYDYSPDHKYLGVLGKQSLLIYQTQTSRLVQSIASQSNQTSLNSFAFSKDSSLLSIGTASGQAYLYNWTDGQYVLQTNSFNHTTSQSFVEELCFTADSSHIILGLLQDAVVAWNPVANTSQQVSFSSEFVKTVSCSPTDPQLFVVGGGGNTLSMLVFYKYDGTNFTIVQNITQTGSEVASTTFTRDGSHLYRVSTASGMAKFDSAGANQVNITDPAIVGKALSKVRVNENERIIATVYPDVNSSKIVLIMADASNTNTAQPIDLTQLLDSSVDSIALSSSGSFLFYVDLDNSGVVANECPNGQTAQPDGTCVGCNPKCISCDGNADTCFSCQPAFYLENNVCQACGFACLQCVDSTVCTTCTLDHNHQVGPLCECDTSYFPDGAVCSKCVQGCLTCNSINVCGECKSGFVPSADNSTCSCAAGTYIVVATETCAACRRGCETCSDGQTCDTCQTRYIRNATDDTCVCNPNEHFIDSAGTCICADPYYITGDRCQQCQIECTSCQQINDCSGCKGDLTVINGVCVCQNGQWHDNTTFNCHNCNDTLRYCVTCAVDNYCDLCDDSLNRESENGVCNCKPGYFNDTNDVCQLCALEGCLKCTDLDTCSSCNTGANYELIGGKCQCVARFFHDVDHCTACLTGCLRCADAAVCTTCDTDNNWVSDGVTGCVCSAAHYPNGLICSPCIVGCLQCDNGLNCNNCDAANHFKPDDNKLCVCESKSFYQDGNTCKYCASALSHCDICDGPTVCEECTSPFQVKDNVCKCVDGKYEDVNECTDCPEGCHLCNSKDECTECKEDYSLEDKVCKKSGIDTLVIVLIVVGVVVLAGAVFVIVKCIKKRKSPLSQDDYEEL